MCVFSWDYFLFGCVFAGLFCMFLFFWVLFFVDVANLDKPGLAPEFCEILNLSIRTSSKKKIEEDGDISFSRLSRWGIEGKLTN